MNLEEHGGGTKGGDGAVFAGSGMFESSLRAESTQKKPMVLGKHRLVGAGAGVLRTHTVSEALQGI